ncbi:MAG: hypothetical protein ACYDCL_15220 [Myxococcales bacterium]
MSPNPSMKPARVTKRVDSFLKGIQKHLAPGIVLNIAGAIHDQASLLAKLQPVRQASRELADARSLVRQKLAARERIHDEIRPFLGDLSVTLAAHFGADNRILAEFGVPYVKPRRQLTVEEKLIASAEGVRTRRSRGSYTSKKQRRDITTEGKPGLTFVDPQGKMTVLLPPAPPGRARPKKK